MEEGGPQGIGAEEFGREVPKVRREGENKRGYLGEWSNVGGLSNCRGMMHWSKERKGRTAKTHTQTSLLLVVWVGIARAGFLR